jgi:hypothetical protein
LPFRSQMYCPSLPVRCTQAWAKNVGIPLFVSSNNRPIRQVRANGYCGVNSPFIPFEEGVLRYLETLMLSSSPMAARVITTDEPP